MLTLTEPFLRHHLCLLPSLMSFAVPEVPEVPEVPDSKRIKFLSGCQHVDSIIFRRIVVEIFEIGVGHCGCVLKKLRI